jgi:hypothetical protein
MEKKDFVPLNEQRGWGVEEWQQSLLLSVNGTIIHGRGAAVGGGSAWGCTAPGGGGFQFQQLLPLPCNYTLTVRGSVLVSFFFPGAPLPPFFPIDGPPPDCQYTDLYEAGPCPTAGNDWDARPVTWDRSP